MSPIPSAPNSIAFRASVGVSAFARTPNRFMVLHISNNSKNSPFISGSTKGTFPSITLPNVPSMVSQSPSLTTISPTLNSLFSSSISTSCAPTTAGLPIPLATTAAWDVFPPNWVSTPLEAYKPCTSSGFVCGRTRIISFSPSFANSSAVSGSKIAIPETAPGDALIPCARTCTIEFSSMLLNNNFDTFFGSTLIIASSFERKPSLTISTAIFTAAEGVRFPFRVCNMFNFPSSIVNSISCISL